MLITLLVLNLLLCSFAVFAPVYLAADYLSSPLFLIFNTSFYLITKHGNCLDIPIFTNTVPITNLFIFSCF